jgi:hypothetical protein
MQPKSMVGSKRCRGERLKVTAEERRLSIKRNSKPQLTMMLGDKN